MVIIGSICLKYWFPDFPRESKDLDIIGSDAYYESLYFSDGIRIERLQNPILEEIYKENINYPYISKNDLLTLKVSHLCWDINWEKHLFDVQFLLKKGCKIDVKLFYKLYEYWNTIHIKNKRSDLKMSKEDFFTNAINYNESQHDELHKTINPIPIYIKVLKDDCEVELDESKFYNLSFEDKLDFVREEVMVMSFERYRELGFKRAYNKMLKKFIISHCPIWCVIFIIENYIELEKCKIDFIKIIENGKDNKH